MNRPEAAVVPAAAIGQVFTPPALVELTLSLALDGLAATRVLDPACGDGAFLAAARARGLDAEGIELHAPTAAAARRRVPGARIETADFLALPPPAPGRAFDLVVGNPPYVRQEALGAARKAEIAARVAGDWGRPARDWPKRADLAAAFVMRALRWLRPGGRVAFVVSTAAFDAGYGDELRAWLDGRARLLALVASARERWFADADIHAAVLLLERTEQAGAGGVARFARLREPVATAATRLRRLADLDAVPGARAVPVAEAARAPWPALLRAPQAHFDAVAAAGEAMVPLSALAEVRRGVTSGANQLFYLSRAQAAADGIESRFLVPLFKTPRQQGAPLVDPAALDTLAFVCDVDDEASLGAFPGARAWVRRHAALAARPSLRARPRWWSLPARPARLFLTKTYDRRFAQRFSREPLVADQRVYALAPREGVDVELLAAALNGTLTALAIESLGRASMGQGALEHAVEDAARLPVLDVRRVDAAAVRAAFAPLARREIGPIPEELDRPDRLALDAALTAHAPAALRALLPAVRAALAETVTERLARSQPR